MFTRTQLKAAAAAVTVATVLAGAAQAADVTLSQGLKLNDPRGLVFGEDGTLYVAESGDTAGQTGAVSAITQPFSASPKVKRIITGLSSNGGEGPEGISIRGDNMYLIVSRSTDQAKLGFMGGPPIADSTPPTFGRLIRFKPDGRNKAIAPVGDYDYDFSQAFPFADNPEAAQDPNGADSNPYGVLALPGVTYVADAGANTIDAIKPDGRIRIAAILPSVTAGDAIPTCLAQGWDGMLYVGTLRGRIYRFDPHDYDDNLQMFDGYGKIQLLDDATNLWATMPALDASNPPVFTIVGCGFGPGGFYVTEFVTSGFAGGDVVKIPINRDGSADTTHLKRYGVDVLNNPNSFTVGPDGNIYVSNNSNGIPGVQNAGEVARINVCDDDADDDKQHGREHESAIPSKSWWCGKSH